MIDDSSTQALTSRLSSRIILLPLFPDGRRKRFVAKIRSFRKRYLKSVSILILYSFLSKRYHTVLLVDYWNVDSTFSVGYIFIEAIEIDVFQRMFV